MRDPKVMVAAICDERLGFLKSLRAWPIFGRGWSTRVAEVKTFSLALADATQGVTPSEAPTVRSGTLPWLVRTILGLYKIAGSADNPAILGMARARTAVLQGCCRVLHRRVGCNSNNSAVRDDGAHEHDRLHQRCS